MIELIRNTRLPVFKIMLTSMLLISMFAASNLSYSTNGVSPAEQVTAMNFVRAKTALQFDKYYARAGGINRFAHSRNVTPINSRSSKRLNRDTLYSVAIVDISKGAMLELPEAGDRYMSVQVVNENGYTNAVFHGGGQYQFTIEQFETSFVWVLVRTLIQNGDEQDISTAHTLQDQIRVSSLSARPYTHVDYDRESFDVTSHLLAELGKALADNSKAAGSREEVDPIKQLIVSAYGFGTLPEKESLLIVKEPNLPSTGAYRLQLAGVPVDGFWSLAIYNKESYFEPNPHNSYGISNQTAIKNSDGSITLHFGGDPQSVNYMPLTEGWNYVVRLYRPRAELLDGTWQFPEIEEISGSGFVK